MMTSTVIVADIVTESPNRKMKLPTDIEHTEAGTNSNSNPTFVYLLPAHFSTACTPHAPFAILFAALCGDCM